jgi:hypothetical protein
LYVLQLALIRMLQLESLQIGFGALIVCHVEDDMIDNLGKTKGKGIILEMPLSK